MGSERENLPDDSWDDRLTDEAFIGSFVQAVIELGRRSGSWRDHIPYSVAISYLSNAEIRLDYAGHVEKCTYCQKLIDVLSPDSDN